MDERAGWTSGASTGSLVAGLAISGLMMAKELQSGQAFGPDRQGRGSAERLGLSTSSKKAMLGLAEQCSVQGLINGGRAHDRLAMREQMTGNFCRCGAHSAEVTPNVAASVQRRALISRSLPQ